MLTIMDKNNETLTTFYGKCLTVNEGTDTTELLGQILADDFASYGSVDSKTKTQLTNQIGFFWKLIPNLKWEPLQIVQQGNTYVVRSFASGTPNGDSMGIPTNGTKTFRMMTIDIHTVEDGQIKAVYHLEDWPTAIKQLKA
jgi:hypothetical protein